MSSLSELLNPTKDMDDHDYATLPSMIEECDEDDSSAYPPGSPSRDGGGEHFMMKERGTSLGIQNLDAWFNSLYSYFKEKGFHCIVVGRVVNLLTLGFTIFFSGFLLLYVDWEALGGSCAEASHETGDPCDILRDATFASPLRHRSALTNFVVVVYLLLFSVYWTWSLVRLVVDLRPLLEMRSFCVRKLQLSDRDIQTITWPEVVARVVHLQATTRLCIVRDLNEHDIVARILRKENYLLGMLNRGVLGLTLDVPGLRGKEWLTKAVEWNVYHAVFHNMFDDDFSIRASFYDVSALRARMRFLAVVNLALSPFIALFMMMYFLLHHVEKFYHDPGSVGHRQWSTRATWRLREFNELAHFTEQRLAAAHKPATRYVAQFPSPAVSTVAKFVSYLVGAWMAFALACTLLVDDRLLHAEVFGRDLLWHTAVMGAVLAASRGMVGEENRVFEPNRWMREVVAHTHYLPRRWRDSAHVKEVQAEFEGMFQFKAALFLQEVLSIFAVPFVLWYPMCRSAPDIVQFVRTFTTHRRGVGHICSLSAFDFRRHGNGKYGAPVNASKPARSKQGKMEKSFLSFHAHYPTWEPDASGREMLAGLAEFRDADPTAKGTAANQAETQTPRASSRSAATSSVFAPPGAASMFFDDAFRGERGGVRGGDVARDASVGTRTPGFIGHGRAPALSDASAFAVSAEDDPAARADERCVAESQVLLQRYYESNVGAGVETRRRDGDDGIVNVDSKNSRAFRAEIASETGGSVRVPRASGAIPARGSSGRANARMETEMSTSLSSSPLSTSPAAFPDPAACRATRSGRLAGAGADGKDPLDGER